MRILHVVPSYLPAVRYGGPIFTVHGLCRALAAKGHELQVFTTNIDGPGITATPIATPVDLDGIQIRYFPCPLVRRLYWAPALGRALHLELGKLASDVEAITSQQPLVLFLGRLSWKKGLDRLLRAFALTPAGILAVVGTDDENFAPRLAKLAAELRIADRVRILPRTVIGSEK